MISWSFMIRLDRCQGCYESSLGAYVILSVILYITTECIFSNIKGRFTYTPNPNRNQTETVTATELHRFVFGRPFTYEPNPWTKWKKMPV